MLASSRLAEIAIFFYLSSTVIFGQYYDDTYSTLKEQRAFETGLFNKTHRANCKEQKKKKKKKKKKKEKMLCGQEGKDT